MSDSMSKMFAGMGKASVPESTALMKKPTRSKPPINAYYEDFVWEDWPNDDEGGIWNPKFTEYAVKRFTTWFLENYVPAPPEATCPDFYEFEEAWDATNGPFRFNGEDHQPGIETSAPFISALQANGFAEYNGGVQARKKDIFGLRFGMPQTAASEADPYIIDRLITCSSNVVITGDPDAGKTRLAIHIAISRGNQPKCFGHFDVVRGNKADCAILFNYDQSDALAQNIRKSLGDDRNMIGVVSNFSMSPATPEFWTGVDQSGASLVIVDTLGSAQPFANVREPQFAAPMILARKWLDEDEARCAIFIHHSPKDTSNKSLTSVVSGTSATAANTDILLHVRKVGGARSTLTQVEYLKFRGIEPVPPSFIVDLKTMQIADRAPKKITHQTDADLIFEAITSNPGRSIVALAEDLSMPRKRASAAVRELGSRVRVDGAGRASKLFPAT